MQQRRHLADRDGAGSEGLDDQAEFSEQRRGLGDEIGLARRHLDDRRHEQRLAFRRAARARGFEALIDEALMRGVLVDDNDPVARLRHDIGLVDLRPRGAERSLGICWRRLEIVQAALGGHVRKRRLRRLCEAGLGWRRIARGGVA